MRAANVAELLARFAPQAVVVGGAREYPRAVARRIIAEATTNRFGVERLVHAGVAIVSPGPEAHASWMQTVFFRNGAAWVAVERASPTATFGVELVSREGYYAGRSSVPVELRGDEELEHEVRSLDSALSLAVAHAGVELPAGAFEHLDRLRGILARRRAYEPARIEALLRAHGFDALVRVSETLYEARQERERVLVTVTTGTPSDLSIADVRGVLPLRRSLRLGGSHSALVERLSEGARGIEDAALSFAQRRAALATIARALHALPQGAGVHIDTIFVDEAGALAGFSPRTTHFLGDAYERSFAVVAHQLLAQDADESLRASLERALHGDRASLDVLLATIGAHA